MMAVEADGGGLRFDEGKPRVDLIAPEFLLALGKLCGDGGLKYDDRNWERGMNWQKCYASLLRHAIAWETGKDFGTDDKTGVITHHMVSVAWNAMVLYTYAIREIGTDDRTLVKKDQ